jgi:hypothetical protein
MADAVEARRQDMDQKTADELVGIERHLLVLPIFLIPDNSAEISGPVVVPLEVLQRLITSRGGLADHPIRPSLRAAGGDKRLLALLMRGMFAVRRIDFNKWYRSEYAKNRWPSQRSSLKAREGRPRKDRQAIRNAIVALVRDGAWSGKDPITKLHRLLANRGRFNMPSHDSLGRWVKQLHAETGDRGLRRVERVRRKRV